MIVPAGCLNEIRTPAVPPAQVPIVGIRKGMAMVTIDRQQSGRPRRAYGSTDAPDAEMDFALLRSAGPSGATPGPIPL